MLRTTRQRLMAGGIGAVAALVTVSGVAMAQTPSPTPSATPSTQATPHGTVTPQGTATPDGSTTPRQRDGKECPEKDAQGSQPSSAARQAGLPPSSRF